MSFFKPLLLSTLLLAGLGSCKQEKVEPTQDYLVFGWYHGFCRGESCIEIFKIDNAAGQLYEDTQDKYPASDAPYDGVYALKSPAQYQQVQTLPQQIPAQLRTQPVGIIGQPDFADGGGYYVELYDNGQRKFWLIDTQKNNIPTYLHPFVDELSAKIGSLQ
ncbi:hypothetical protein SAMN02745146_1229 [Hymenobacter daecheongensis DSM 21074]|uniref:Lipoprotein n=1 Tax=Hymenobacter daecheongensis DSM 21074 TaxID=1121955 RepID=A0A1M6CPN8_9BACT|nr:hypothetical protein [Hymenobacter daecheongensis]SHI63055.1 hypothetical protein SAMN02745146_1229 [Hymenobacter daecheongensis DSM 21074]